ncbi:MAG: TonB-dependent receptor [Bacteroides sp.]|nr:TonB-dependent receptor [Bacteroides sp.]
MKMRTLLLVALTLCSIALAAQNTSSTSFQVKGVLLDSITGEGEPYATIKITRKEAPKQAVKMMVTDMKGRFQEKVTGTGNFVITISSVGRNTIVKDFAVKSDEKVVDLGTLYVTDATKELGQVEIVAQKPLVKADIDKIEYNVQDDPDSKSNSVLEMLRKVPLVTVDGEDNIKVNGSSSFKVFVNGKPNNMMSNNPTEVLKSMPANSIKNIEVITNPGPKYDAEGVGGILNIITVGSGMEGYTVTVGTNVNNRGVGGNLFGTVQKGKLTVSGRYNYSYSNQAEANFGGTLQTLGEVTNRSYVQQNTGFSDNKGSFQSGSLEASYEIDTLRLLSMSFGMWGGDNKGYGITKYLTTSPLTSNELYRYQSDWNNKSSWYSIDGGLDYQRSSARVKGRLFTLSYKINTRPNSSDSYSDYNDMNAAPDWSDFITRLKDQYTDGSENTTEQTFQADYTTPIGKLHTVEGGVKYIMRDNTSEDDRFERPSGTDTYSYDKENSSHYKHQNDILAAYFGYGLKWKKLSGRLGVRYEHTIQDVKYVLGKGDDFRKDFDDVVPSASIGLKLTDMSNLRLGYNMRIYRPGIWALNPYLSDSNPTNVSRGNPNLESEKGHSINLSYSNFTPKFNINFSVRYGFTNNSIDRVTNVVPDTEVPGYKNPTGQDVLYSTYENIGKSRNLNFSSYINWNATKNTRIYANLFGGYIYLKSANGLKNDGWNLFAFGGAQQTLPKDWRISLNIYGQTPWVLLQGKTGSSLDYGLSVSKSFLKKRLSLSAFANNFFSKYRNYNTSTGDTSFQQDTWRRNNNLRYGMSISYRMGELKASVKKAKRTINNDDVKGSGGNGGGGN